MNPEYIAGMVFLLGVAFGSGMYAMALRMTRKQINGMGGRVNRVILAVMHVTPADKQEEVVRIIMGETKEK